MALVPEASATGTIDPTDERLPPCRDCRNMAPIPQAGAKGFVDPMDECLVAVVILPGLPEHGPQAPG